MQTIRKEHSRSPTTKSTNPASLLAVKFASFASIVDALSELLPQAGAFIHPWLMWAFLHFCHFGSLPLARLSNVSMRRSLDMFVH